MMLGEEKQLDKLLEELKKLDEEQAIREEKYRLAGLPDCLGTSKNFGLYMDRVNKIHEEIYKLN